MCACVQLYTRVEMGSCLGGDSRPREEATAHSSQPASQSNTEKTGLLSTSTRSASYSVRREGGATDLHHSATIEQRSAQLVSSVLSSTSCYLPNDLQQAQMPTSFQFLDKNYSFKTPSCLLPMGNELFKAISERYDIAVTNREKVDEALQLFKKVLEVDINLPIADCFSAWKSQLTAPVFTVTRHERLGDVKQVTVRAEEVPRLKRKAQKHIRDLLDACHLFLQQRDFLQREIRTSLEELDRVAKDLPMLLKETKSLSSSERKSMPQVVKQARDQFAQFPGTIDQFWNQVFVLLREINEAVHILQEE